MIVAEIGASHGGDLGRAQRLIHSAARAGADAVKLQTFRPEDMASANAVCDTGPWVGWNLRQLYAKTALPWEWHEELFGYARGLGLLCFSTPFSVDAVDFLEQFKPPCYKLASFEITHYPLIARIAQTGKRIYISTGCATDDDIHRALAILPNEYPVVLMHCVSSYPAQAEDFFLPQMLARAKDFNTDYGLSDHSKSPTAAILAAGLGASVIEKHITTAEGFEDDAFALSEREFAEQARLIQESVLAMQPGMVRSASAGLRRSLHAARDIGQGETISTDDLCYFRGEGLHPAYAAKLIGSAARRTLKAGEPLTRIDAA
jgi:pseudaminic acid synthase